MSSNTTITPISRSSSIVPSTSTITPSKGVLDLLESVRQQYNKNDPKYLKIMSSLDNSSKNNDINQLLSPTIDDVINDLNPSRPIFPSPILVNNTITLSSSSPLHYPQTPEQFTEIDNKYNDINTGTTSKHNEECSQTIDNKIWNYNDGNDNNNLRSVIAKSSVESGDNSIATSVRLLFLTQKYLGIRTYDHMRKKRALRASEFTKLKTKHNLHDSESSYDQQTIRNTSTNATLIEEDGTLEAWLIFCPALTIYGHLYTVRKQNFDYLMNYEEWLQNKVLLLAATQVKADIFRALCLYCGTNSHARIHHERRLLHKGFDTFIENMMRKKLLSKKKVNHYTSGSALKINSSSRVMHRDLPFTTNSTKYGDELTLLSLLNNLRKTSEKLYGSSTFFSNTKKYTNTIINTIFRKRNSIYNLYANYMASSSKDKSDIQERIFDAIYLAFGLRRLYKRTIYYGKIERLIKQRKSTHLTKAMKAWMMQMSSYAKLSKDFDNLIIKFHDKMMIMHVKHSFHRLRRFRRESIEFRQFLHNYGKQIRRHHIGLRCGYMLLCPALVKCFLVWQDVFVKDGMKIPEKRLADKHWRTYRLHIACRKWTNWARTVQSQLVPHKQLHGNTLLRSNSNSYRINKQSQLAYNDNHERHVACRQSQLARAFWKLLSFCNATRFYNSPSDLAFSEIKSTTTNKHVYHHHTGSDLERQKALSYRRIASVKLYSNNINYADIDAVGGALPLYTVNPANAVVPIRAKYYGTITSKASHYRPTGGRCVKLLHLDSSSLTTNIRTFFGDTKGSSTISSTRISPKKRSIAKGNNGDEVEFRFYPKPPTLVMSDNGMYLASAPMLAICLRRLLIHGRRYHSLKIASQLLKKFSLSLKMTTMFLSWKVNWKVNYFRNRKLRTLGYSYFKQDRQRVLFGIMTMKKSEKMRLRRNLRGLSTKTRLTHNTKFDGLKIFISSILKNSAFGYVMNKYATKFKFKNIKKSVVENTLFASKPSRLHSSSSSSPSKRNNVIETESLFDYDDLIEQALFLSKSLWNLSAIKTGLLRLRNNASRCRMRKTLLAPIIKKEKKGVFQWLTMMMILRSKARALNLKRTKKSLMKWVVSAVGKRAHRSLIRGHFTPFLNEYKKCCYKRAWDITWGKRLREGWVAWNKEVFRMKELAVKAQMSDRRRLKLYGMFKLRYNTKSRLMIRKSIKRLVLRLLKRFVKRKVKLRRKIHIGTISRGMTRLYKSINIARPHEAKALQVMQSKVFGLKLLPHRSIMKALRYLKKDDDNKTNNDDIKTPKKLSNKKKTLADMTMIANLLHFSSFCRHVFKRLKNYTNNCQKSRRTEHYYYYIMSKLLWIKAVKDIIWKRNFLKELLMIADGFREERMMRTAIVIWRLRARKNNSSRRWSRTADKYCVKRLKALGLIFLRAGAVYSLPSSSSSSSYSKISVTSFYPKSTKGKLFKL